MSHNYQAPITMHHFPDPLPSGTILQERFAVTRVLAMTNVSSVYVAYDRWFNRKVVVKRLSTSLRPGGRARTLAVRDFVREARLLRTLHHPQLPHLQATFRTGSDCYIVMNYIDGAPLDQVLANGSLAPAEAMMIADSLCDVVAYLHAQQPAIIHADIKPSNVIWVGQRAVLLDLGLARPREPTTFDEEPIGTLPYAPPEQRRGSPLDERSDIYALGMLLHEVFDPAQDAPLHCVLTRAIAFNPDDRYASVRLLQRALYMSADPRSNGESPTQLLPNLKNAVLLFVVFLLIALLFLLLSSHPAAQGPGALMLPMLI